MSYRNMNIFRLKSQTAVQRSLLGNGGNYGLYNPADGVYNIFAPSM